MDLGCAGGLEEGKRLHEVVYASNDAIEGPKAFAEKTRTGLDRNLMETGMTELIRLDRDGPVGILRFLQPAKRNPYSIGFVEELVALLREAERDDTIRAVVMTGGDHFSSGGDLVGFQAEIAKGARATSEMVDRFTMADARPICFGSL